MTEPLNRGASLRAALIGFCLFLIAAFAFAPRAHAEPAAHPQHAHVQTHKGKHHATRHHHWRAHHCHYKPRAHAHRSHRRQRVAIDMRTGAVEPVANNPFAFMGSLFQPPAPPALLFDHAVLQPIDRAAGNLVTAAGSYGRRGYAAVAAMARKMGLPVSLGLAEAKQESSGNCHARSRTDARGVLQVEPYTAEKDGFDPSRLFECEYGALAGLTELKKQIEAEGGITCHALSRYYGSDIYLRRFRGGCAPYGREVLARMRAIERSPRIAASLMLAEWEPAPGHHRHRHRWGV